MTRLTRSSAQRQLSPQTSAEEKRAASPRKRDANMTSTKDSAPVSDTETAEKPVREQLKKASIGSGDVETTRDPSLARANGEEAAPRGRLQRKRSFEEVEPEHPEQPAGSGAPKSHTRKRSRDSTAEEHELHNGQWKASGEKSRDGDNAAVPASDSNGTGNGPTRERSSTPELSGETRGEVQAETFASPKTKRSRLHSTGIEGDDTLTSVPSTQDSAQERAEPTGSSEAPLTEDATAATAATVKELPKGSGFANTSATSPFGALAGSKSPTTELRSTSPTAFASSGFGSLAASTTSGFGAIGKSTGGFGTGGTFATGGKSPLAVDTSKETEKPKESTGSAFGGELGQKSAFAATPSISGGFGSGGSGFGKLGGGSTLGGGFGSGTGGFGGLGGSGGLTSFASGKPTTSLAGSSKPTLAFGASAGDAEEGDEGADEDEAGFKSPPHQQDEKQDERFFAQELETGEEDEISEYSCRAKLYNFAAVEGGKKEWRERGLGVLRLNVKKDTTDSDGHTKTKARFLMRAEGSHRVVLNTPVKKEIKFGAPSGGAPTGGFMYFMGTIDGKEKLELLQLKIRQQFALELYDKVVELQSEM